MLSTLKAKHFPFVKLGLGLQVLPRFGAVIRCQLVWALVAVSALTLCLHDAHAQFSQHAVIGNVPTSALPGPPTGNLDLRQPENLRDSGAVSSSSATLPTPALLPAPSLSGPSNGLTGISVTPTFSWSSVSGANRYWLTVATSASTLPTDPTATSCPACIISGNTDATSYTTPNAFPYSYHTATLSPGTTYYWRVQGGEN